MSKIAGGGHWGEDVMLAKWGVRVQVPTPKRNGVSAYTFDDSDVVFVSMEVEGLYTMSVALTPKDALRLAKRLLRSAKSALLVESERMDEDG